MIDQDEILEVVQFLMENLKKVAKIDKNNVYLDNYDFLGSNYLVALDMWEQIKVHSEGLHFPNRLFKSKAPNEDDAMYGYRESIYQPYTKPDWRRGVNNYDRVFNPQNFTVDKFGNDEGIYKNDKAKDYFKSVYPYDNSIISYYRTVVKIKKLEDPNGVIALDFTMNDFEKPDTELLEPVGSVFNTDRVWEYNHKYVLIHRTERSTVKYYKQDRALGFVFWLYDDENIWEIRQIGDWGEFSFEFELVYNHDLGYIPAKRLGGVPIDKDLYQSHVMDATYPLNDVLFDSSTLSASKIAHAYPQKWEFDDDCPNPNCDNGDIIDYDDDQKEIRHKCDICGGKGHYNTNPLTTYKIKRLSGMEDGEPTPNPPMGFVEMDSSILEFLREEINQNRSSSFQFLGVDMSTTNAKGSDTALSKIIDRETLFSSLLDFSNEIWDLLEFNIDFVGNVRYSDFINPSIKRPTNFAVRNEQDLTEEYTEAKEKGLPDIYQVGLLEQLTESRFGSDELMKRILELKQKIDRLFSLDTEQANKKKALGLAAAWEVILHDSFDTYIGRKLEEDPNYLDKDLEEITTDLVAMAQADVPVIQNGSTAAIIGD